MTFGQNNMGNTMGNNMGNMGGNSQQGGQNTKTVSFDSNIKVVELDTKVSDGFFYSGSKNLDPFSK